MFKYSLKDACTWLLIISLICVAIRQEWDQRRQRREHFDLFANATAMSIQRHRFQQAEIDKLTEEVANLREQQRFRQEKLDKLAEEVADLRLRSKWLPH